MSASCGSQLTRSTRTLLMRPGVASLWRFVVAAWSVEFCEHGVIDAAAKRILDGVDERQAVRGELNPATRETVCKIAHEQLSGPLVARANHPGRHQLAVGVQRRPRPNAADHRWRLLAHLAREVPVATEHERPNFIELETTAVLTKFGKTLRELRTERCLSQWALEE